MSELLSILIASVIAASIGIGISAADISSAAVKAEKNGTMKKTIARLDFKQAENKANADYKAAISNCKKNPSVDKRICLENAKTVNGKIIVAAKETWDKAVTEASVPK